MVKIKVLITGFDPFNDEKINPAFESIKRLDNIIGGNEIYKLEVPTSFSRVFGEVERIIGKLNPDIILHIGQAGGRHGISLERVAINLEESNIPDNDGDKPTNRKIKEKGENAYFSNLPIHLIVEYLRARDIPTNISYSAGTYVCNSLMYRTLSYISEKNLQTRVGFIHVPFILEQVANKEGNHPSMSLDTISRALTHIIEAITENN